MKNKIIDRIMIVNELDRKFNFDEGFLSYSTSPLLPQKQHKSKIK